MAEQNGNRKAQGTLDSGATALVVLLERIKEIGNAACLDSDADTRDYKTMAAEVRRSIEGNLINASPQHAEGYLRAMTDLLNIVTDGCGLSTPYRDWDPIATTAHSFDPSVAGAP